MIAWLLIGLAFLSKISFAFTGLVPSQAGYFIFQHGLHPYLNASLSLALSAVISWMWLRQPQEVTRTFPAPFLSYKIWSFALMAVLAVQSLLQLIILPDLNLSLSLSALVSTLCLLWIFGLLIPRLISLEDFLKLVGIGCLILCSLSLFAFLLSSPYAFKGNRFIGIFKHIPYMVTAATVGFIFSLFLWSRVTSFLSGAGLALAQGICLYALLLTGTRSAFFAVILSSGLIFLRLPSRNTQFQMARVLAVGVALSSAFFFGGDAFEFGRALIRGEAALGQRQAQDGISDRMDEIDRGLQILTDSPHIGLGLLSKFGGSSADDAVGSYDSFQDPHNLIISAAVIGGWPLALILGVGFLMLVIRAAFLIFRGNTAQLVLGAYLLSHAPILFIYHAHLSLGGLADRLYWLCFGFAGLSLNFQQFSSHKMKKLY